MDYNWQQSDWPYFRYDLKSVRLEIEKFVENALYLKGLYDGLHPELQLNAAIDIMVEEAMKTSEIEGEFVSRKDVRSSIRNQLQVGPPIQNIRDHRAKGVATMMVQVREGFAMELSATMLFAWHKSLFPRANQIHVGAWRTHSEPMQIVSSDIVEPEVHFEAPPSAQVPDEMNRYIQWFNDAKSDGKHMLHDAPVRSAIAHIYFESIHPFEDGNGRIGRALSEKILSQHVGQPVLLSLSKTIQHHKIEYYEKLKENQKANEITSWVEYFIRLITTSQENTKQTIELIIKKTRFFDRHKTELNPRHEKVLRRMLEEGPDGFEGGMSAKKYQSLTKVSKATATRDLQYLAAIGALVSIGEGRGVRYQVHLT
ncbi:MAG: Fic family protein [Bdellovibrionota bacterium]